tara:strand:+ start:931 stop:1116 length:186 start_codon:yes stop_codon:yes gene_type:complete
MTSRTYEGSVDSTGAIVCAELKVDVITATMSRIRDRMEKIFFVLSKELKIQADGCDRKFYL